MITVLLADYSPTLGTVRPAPVAHLDGNANPRHNILYLETLKNRKTLSCHSFCEFGDIALQSLFNGHGQSKLSMTIFNGFRALFSFQKGFQPSQPLALRSLDFQEEYCCRKSEWHESYGSWFHCPQQYGKCNQFPCPYGSSEVEPGR